eukprot:5458300-Pleurochrysis_carterae.AAC.1
MNFAERQQCCCGERHQLNQKLDSPSRRRIHHPQTKDLRYGRLCSRRQQREQRRQHRLAAAEAARRASPEPPVAADTPPRLRRAPAASATRATAARARASVHPLGLPTK